MAIERTGGVDAAIDDAARAMTAAVPPPSLRLAISTRVTVAPGLGPTVTPWLGVAAAAIVVVVAAVLWMSRPSPVSTPATGGMPPTTAAAPVGAAAVPPPQVVRAAAPVRVVPRDSSVTRRTAPRTVPPSTIEVTPVAIVPLSTEAVVVEPVPAPEAIEITPIAVAPLLIGVAGDALEE